MVPHRQPEWWSERVCGIMQGVNDAKIQSVRFVPSHFANKHGILSSFVPEEAVFPVENLLGFVHTS